VAKVINSPLIVVVGETASGKSKLALQLAQQFAGEIICADSTTVRREINIGSAKPSKNEQSIIRHHLIDIIGANEVFTAACFQGMATQEIMVIAARAKLPIMVGGSGLYIDGVLYDYSFLETADHTELNNLDSNQLIDKAISSGLDISNIDENNKRRLIRFIESEGRMPTKKPMRTNTLVIGLSLDRSMLLERVTKRVNSMLDEGLEDEVKGLVNQYGWSSEALKAIGYSQWQDYVSGSQSLDETRRLIINHSMKLAKRQRTWFKRNKSIHWFSNPVNYTSIVELVTTFLDESDFKLD
jgi:tRNA dimethylallyltransferase